MADVGYARVSSVGQSLEVQQEKLVSTGSVNSLQKNSQAQQRHDQNSNPVWNMSEKVMSLSLPS